jgi:hypothetical protein
LACVPCGYVGDVSVAAVDVWVSEKAAADAHVCYVCCADSFVITD